MAKTATRAVVQDTSEAKLRRFTIDMDEGLHRRIKAACALEGTHMGDAVRAVLEREWPVRRVGRSDSIAAR